MSTPTTVIITAAGEGSRWGNHLGVPKHLLPAPGSPSETILGRTTRLVRRFDPLARVVITGPAEYKQPGAELFTPVERPDDFECSIYTWAEPLWAFNQGRTVFLYGDTFYTPTALLQILDYRPREWHLWARFKESSITGKTWPEVWAHSFWPEQSGEEIAAIVAVTALRRKGKLRRASIYEMYKWRHNALLPFTYDQKDLGGLTQIDDWTEDFDFPKDYDEFVRRYEARHVGR